MLQWRRQCQSKISAFDSNLKLRAPLFHSLINGHNIRSSREVGRRCVDVVSGGRAAEQYSSSLLTCRAKAPRWPGGGGRVQRRRQGSHMGGR